MDNIALTRKERILMFLNEYYFGGSALTTLLRLFSGPPMFYIGLTMYSKASDRVGIGYGGLMVVFSIYYTFKPFLWILFKWKYFRSVEFRIEATADRLLIQEDGSESQTEYSKFERIVKRTNYFALSVQKGLKIYLPIAGLSASTVDTLTQHEKK